MRSLADAPAPKRMNARATVGRASTRLPRDRTEADDCEPGPRIVAVLCGSQTASAPLPAQRVVADSHRPMILLRSSQ